ncbi:MAG: Serine/threonine protein kinase PrkC, regulator of stationary phase, partial [Alphaproteobacteria bacterium]|nr:Serine/threonine protein kinase PrkC, regulator of stationary phase [Alphaproteobacteria bacterium]
QKCRKIGAAPYQWVLLLRPYLLWQRGELAQARAQVDLSLAYPHIGQNMLAKHHLLALEAQITLEEGDWAGAAGKLAKLEATARETGMQLSLMMALLVRAELSRVCRAFGPARLAAQEVHTLASSGPARNPYMQGRAALMLGRLAIVQTDWPLAERYLNEALAIASRPEQDNLIEQAHALLALGELHAGTGDRAAATASLRQAGELYHQLKNSHWLHTVTQRLEALHQDIRQASATVEASPEARWQFMSGMMR